MSKQDPQALPLVLDCSALRQALDTLSRAVIALPVYVPVHDRIRAALSGDVMVTGTIDRTTSCLPGFSERIEVDCLRLSPSPALFDLACALEREALERRIGEQRAALFGGATACEEGGHP
jgi:hypothetical protein